MRRTSMLALSVLLFAGTAHAFDTDGLADQMTATKGGTTQIDLAQQHFDAGVLLYKEGKWRLARFEFQASYDLSKSPDLLHNLSMTAEHQGALSDAIAFEEKFFQEKGAGLSEEERAQVIGRLDRLRGQQVLQANASASTPTLAPAPTAAHEGGYRPPAGAIALIGVGAGLLAIGIGTGVGALSVQNTINAGGSYLPDDYMALYNRGQALNACAISFDVIGGVVGAAGVFWTAADRVRRGKK